MKTLQKGTRALFVLWGLLLLTGVAFAQGGENLVFEAAREHFKGNLPKALELFQEVAVRDPQNTYAQNQLGVIYAKQEQAQEALKAFERVKAQDPLNIFARNWIGILRLKLGQMDRAFSEFEEILSVDSENANAHYYLGAIYNIRRNRRAAIVELKKARDANSQEPDTHFRLAQAFHNADRCKTPSWNILVPLSSTPGTLRP